MSKFSEFAEQWVTSNEQGHTPVKGFARMLADANRGNMRVSDSELATLYHAATKNNAYATTSGMADYVAKRVREFAAWFDAGITTTPAPASDVMGCRWGGGYLVCPDGQPWNPYYTSINNPKGAHNHFRELLHDAAKAGVIREQRVTICGKPAMYLYSL